MGILRMNRIIKRLIKSSINKAVKATAQTSFGLKILDQSIRVVMSQTRSTRHNGIHLVFSVPNRINNFRFETFSTKEPETLEWIDSIPQGSVLWDIGANVGLYSCYAAKARGCQVFAFEPSVFNLEQLARNIFLNKMTKQVVIIPLPLSENLSFNTLNMSSTDWGASRSTFGEDYGYDGQPLDKIFEFQTVSLSMMDAVELLKTPQPDYIKMDVDGIEHLILKGGSTLLQNIKGILIEIDEGFEQQSVDSTQRLRNAGLELKEKRQSDMFKDSAYTTVYNQIWYRPSP
jgi:FkbM family methyltransferase